MSTPLRRELKKEDRQSFDSLYHELDTYIQELDSETMTHDTEKMNHPSFKVITTEPSSEEESSNSSSITSINTILSRQDSLKSATENRQNINLMNMIHFNLYQYNDDFKLNTTFMSELSNEFISQVKVLIESRELFCSTEYPKSFTGEEAVNIISNIVVNDNWTRKECRNLLRSFMQAVPPLFVPVAYSNKSLKRNTLYDSQKEVYTLDDGLTTENINGVITCLSDCYTPMCIKGFSNGCYAPTCPNKGSQLLSKSNIVNKELQRNISLSSSVASSQDTFVSRCWSNTVSPEIRQKTSSKEIKRQEAICELIYTEEDYVRDLNLLDDLFAKPLLTAQCIEPEKRSTFCHQVFYNYSTIADLHRQMYRELRDYQLSSIDEGGFVDQVGDILLKYVYQFMEMYTKYAPNFIIAEYIAKREMSRNILFQNFIREKEKQAETRKLPFRHFIILPITRLQKYRLLLDAIYKKTDNVEEKQKLNSCIEVVVNVAKEMNRLMEKSKEKLRIRQVNDLIQFKLGSDQVDLDLLNPDRMLIYEGPLKRRSSNLIVDSVDLHVFLFDHLFIMTKSKKSQNSDTIESYTISKKPIPLNLLSVEDVAENFIYSTFRSSTKSSSTNPIPTSNTSQSSLNDTQQQQQQQYVNQSSLLIRHLGRHGGEYILYADKPSSRYIWKGKLHQAQTDLLLKEKPNNVFKLSAVNDTTSSQFNHGKPTCVVPFVGEGGRKMVALGTQQGVWMGKESGGSTDFKRVLQVTDVTQMAILTTQNIILVLADKVLTAYPIAQLDPYATHQDSKRKSSDKYAISFRILASNISYFNTGTCYEKTLVIVMKRKGSDSHFKAFEPTCGNLKDAKNSKLLVTKTSFMSKPPAWFKIYKEFYIGMDSTAVHFLKSKVLVACPRGFEVIDLEHLNVVSTSFPDLHHRDYRFIVNTCTSSSGSDLPKPLSIFRCNEKNFLLCYDKFAFLMSTHGDYIKGYKRIEWEGNPVSVAFHYPYVLAFDPKFIEIRHVETGKLVQTIIGDNTRYLPSAINNTNVTSTNMYCSATHQFKQDNQFIFKLEPLYNNS